MLVLAVEGEQRAAELAQVGDGRRAPVEVGARAPVGADAAREHQLLGVGAQALAELLAQAVRAGRRPLDVGLAGAGANDPRPRAPAQQQVERVGEHRLAGAGLAGEHVQPGRQPQLGLLDQQQVLDAKLLQHVRWSSSGTGTASSAVSERSRRRPARRLAGAPRPGRPQRA